MINIAVIGHLQVLFDVLLKTILVLSCGDIAKYISGESQTRSC